MGAWVHCTILGIVVALGRSGALAKGAKPDLQMNNTSKDVIEGLPPDCALCALVHLSMRPFRQVDRRVSGHSQR
jgi:hypothetical protein